MNQNDFEGTLVLERLAEIDRLDEFFEAVDSDDVERAIRVMRQAGIDARTMATVVKKMTTSDSEH